MKVAKARESRLREIRLWSSVRQLVVYGCYLAVLYALIYGDRNPHCFHQVHHLKRFLLNPQNYTHDYTQVRIQIDRLSCCRHLRSME